MTRIRGWTLSLATLALLPLTAPGALGAQQPADSAEVAELRRQIEVVTRELEALRLGGDVVQADTSVLGFGPAASKVYQVGRGVSIGGYGEVLYENASSEREDGAESGRSDRVDALRGIVYVGYKFDDRLLFNSEIEVEHGSTDLGGSVSLEFAYLDYRLSDALGVRAGLLLVPMGLVNELHEPPVFLGTTRPLTENRIIPTTWRENGIGLFGDAGGFSWRAYLVNSFDGAGTGAAGGFGASGLRGGRQKGAAALAEDLAWVGRVDYQGLLGLTVGGSAFYGETAQNAELDGEEVGGGTLLWEAHADYQARGLDLRALVAGASVSDAAELSELRGLAGSSGIGERMLGWYVQAGYDVLRGGARPDQLIPYVRYERVDTQAEVPAGFTANPANDTSVLSLGAAWKPLVNVVFKADHQIHSNDAETGVNQLNLALGYLF